MSTIKISELPAILGANTATTDVLPIVDVSGNTTNKITREEFFKNIASVDINGGTVDGAVIGGSSAAAITGTTITATGDVTIADKIIHAGDTNTAIRFPAADTVTVETAGAERLRIDSSGNVGVGTASPAVRLEASGGIADVIAGTAQVIARSGDNTNFNQIRVRATATESRLESLAAGTGTSSPLVIHTGGSERMRITDAGNVGIGTSSPERLLTVAGTTGDASGIIRLQSNNVNVADGLIGSVEYFNTDTSTDGPQIAAAINAYTVTTQGAGGYLTFATATGATGVEGASPIERLRITSTGNVGIGTSSPDFQLHVNNSAGNATIGIIAADANNSILYMGDQTSDTVAYIQYNHPSNFMNFRTNSLDRMRIDSAGNVGIGTSSPGANLDVAATTGSVIRLTSTSTAVSADDPIGLLQFYGSDASAPGAGVKSKIAAYAALGSGDGSYLTLSTSDGVTNDIERMRIDDSGNLLVGKTASNYASVGAEIRPTTGITITRDGGDPLAVNRLTSDGTLVTFSQAGTTEGTISVSGTTVSYNGGHLSRWAQFPDNSRPELLKGTVMSNLDQMSNWDGEDNEQLNCVQVSAVEGDANVAGVFVAWDSTDDDYNDILLAMTGDMVIRIAGGTTVQRGDLLMSAGNGTAKPQGDDIVRSKTIAKVTSTHVSHTYADGSYAVPCVLMAC